MKTINPQKLPVEIFDRQAPDANSMANDHQAAANALLAAYAKTRSYDDLQSLTTWALSTGIGPQLGGNHPATLRRGVEEIVEQVDTIVAAEQHLKDHGKEAKPLVAAIGAAGEDIAGLQATIAELEAAIAGKRKEQADAEADLQAIENARDLVAAVESESDNSRRKQVWKIVKTGKHAFA